MSQTVYVVHCIDTEGPLHESLEATFQRLKAIFNLDLEPSTRLLRRLQAGEEKLGGLEAAVRKVVDPHLLGYNDTWDKVDAMLVDCMSGKYRMRVRDSFGGGWVYNWFCVDHVDYESNPRRRDIGYHHVYDHYRHMVRETDSPEDGFGFHFHPHSFGKAAHHCATHWWATSGSLHQILSRRVIDRQWFPSVHRPGFHVLRPDSHWFLEQFIPFDYSNQALARHTEADKAQSGLDTGRFGDWRRAPAKWQPYHPSQDDYQVPGSCRRWIARCLNVGTRYGLLTESDVRQAFEDARAGKPAVMGFTNHDFRDMRPDVDGVLAMLGKVSCEFPDVPFKFAEATSAMRDALGLESQPACELETTLRAVDGTTHVLEVSSRTPTFGSQPWLALKTTAGTYHHDNFDTEVPFHKWRYVFDDQTFPINALSHVGVAANNATGTTSVAVLTTQTGKVSRQVWNEATARDRVPA